jgi:radical SAM-linked protein
MIVAESPKVANAEAPHPQLPVARRIRLRYAKRGRMRFTSHRDIGRALERAVRRAAIPIAFSSGFSPHPRISYVGAAPTGAASEAEYAEIALTEEWPAAAVRSALDASLPAGLDVVDAVVAGPGSLADRIEASVWDITLGETSPTDLESAAAAFAARDAVEVSRMTKKGLRTFDCRSAVVRLDVRDCADEAGGDSCAILQVVLRHGTPSVRPDDVLAGLGDVVGLRPQVPPLLNRVAQGPLDAQTGTVGDPLAPDRDTSAVPRDGRVDRGGETAAR